MVNRLCMDGEHAGDFEEPGLRRVKKCRGWQSLSDRSLRCLAVGAVGAAPDEVVRAGSPEHEQYALQSLQRVIEVLQL